ncbi:MAG: HEAT repeat domain-containing protein [Verrucomicrobia bacterium]|nr:HEAT repeat domain-containing protein [Leptolyngbya sp. ES-bin-22]
MRTLRRHKFGTLLGLSATCLSLVLLQSDRSATQIPNANQNTVAPSKLVAALKDPDPQVRFQAAATLYKIDSQREAATAVMIAALKDPNPKVRAEAANAIAALDPKAQAAIPALLVALKDPESQVRYNAAQALRFMGAAAKVAIPDLIKALSDVEADGSYFMVNGAVDALIDICLASKVVPPALIATLRQRNPPAKLRGTFVLSELGALARVATPELTMVLRDSNPFVRLHAVIALGKIGKPAKAATPALTKLLKDRYESVRVVAASALWDVGVKPAVVLPTLIAGVKARYGDKPLNPQEAVTTRHRAVSTLEDMGAAAKPAIPVLTAALKDQDEGVRLAAERALTKIKGAQDGDISLLLIALKSPNSREQAISDLAGLGAKAKLAVPMLLTILKQDENYRIRRIVPFALVAISPNDKAVIAALIAAFKERDDEVRASAAFALGEIGPAAQAAVPALVAALKARPTASPPTWDSVPAAFALVQIGAAQDVAVPVLAAVFKDGTCNLLYGYCTEAAKALRKAGSDTKLASSALVKLLSKVEPYSQVGIALTLLALSSETEAATTALIAVANSTERSPVSSSDKQADWSGSDRRYLAHRMAGMAEGIQKNPYRLSAAEMAMTVARLEQVLQVLETPKEPKVSEATLERIRRSLSVLKAQKNL